MSLDWTTFTDGELAILSMAGRDAAFAEIMSRHRQAIFRLIRASVGGSDDALDLVQETFISAHQAMKRFDSERSMRAWLSTIAINKCRDWGRKRIVRRFLFSASAISVAAEQVVDDQAGQAAVAEDREQLDRVAQAIAKLPTNLREPLVLRTIEGLSQADTAAILSISEKAVETRLARARAKLQLAIS